jgi:hypothetical protein
MAHILLLAPACADYHARHCAVRDIGQPHSELCTFDCAQWLLRNEDALKKRQLSADLPKVI